MNILDMFRSYEVEGDGASEELVLTLQGDKLVEVEDVPYEDN